MKNTLIKFLIPILIILIFGLIGIKALFHPGYFTSHDAWHQVVRLFYYDKSIKDGVFPPNYVRNLYFGYGYPLFIFSYHTPWIIAEPFMLAGLSVFDSIKAVYIIGFLLSGITMHFFLRSKFGQLEALCGSILYLWVPYHFSNIYVRGAIGENTVFIFIPLLFYAIDYLTKKFRWSVFTLGVISFACIILSHAVVALLVISSSILYILFQAIFSKNIKKYLLRIVGLFFMGILLSSFYLLPSFSLRKYTVFDERILATNNEGQYVSLKELLYSKWGYGFSVPRSFDSMSFQVGIAQWLVVFSLLIYLVIKLKKFKQIKELSFLLGLIFIFLISIFLITSKSAFVWEIIEKKLFNIDFPWRLLTVVVFVSSSLSAYLLFILPKKVKILVFTFLIIIAVYTNRNHIRVNEYTNFPLGLFLLSETTTNTYDEYLPKGINANEIKKMKKGGEIESESKAEITGIDSKVNSLAFNYSSIDNTLFTINQLYFPGWELLIDNKKTDFYRDELGLIKFRAEKGDHRVYFGYSGTKEVVIAGFLSLLSLSILFFGFFVNAPKK